MKYLIIFLFFLTFSYSQKKEDVDDLILKFESTINSDTDSAYVYILQAEKICQKTNNDFLLARCQYKLGYYFYTLKNNQKATYFLKNAIVNAERTKNYKALASAYNQLGVIDMDKSAFNESLKKLLLAINIAEKNKLFKNQCSTTINLGNLFDLQKDTLRALEYYQKGKKIAEKNGLEEYKISCYNNIAVLLRDSNKEKSISYYKKAYNIAVALKDTYQQFSLLINLADANLSIKSDKTFNNAYKYLKLAESLAIDEKNEQNLFYVYFNFGGYYNKIKEYETAETYYLKAKQLSKTGMDNEQILNLYKAIEKNFLAKTDYRNAYLYKDKYNKLEDSIFTIEKNKTFQDIKTKYDVEKKNLKINLLSKERTIEKNKKRLITYTSLAVITSLLLLLLLFINRNKLQKIIRKKEKEMFFQEKEKLQQEQELKRITGLIEGQDIERNRIAKEIHDGIGGDLAGIKLKLSQINEDIKNQHIGTIISQIGGTFTELRNISHNLSSNFILNKDFSLVLSQLINEYETRKEFATELTIFPENAFAEINQNIKHQIFRILQESMANVSKHAKAKSVAIMITILDEVINIIFEDDGIGFDEKSQKGIGLKNIEERVFSLKGTIEVETIVKRGSTLIINIPK